MEKYIKSIDYGEEILSTNKEENEIKVNFNHSKMINTIIPLRIKLDSKKRSLLIEFIAKQENELPIALLLPSKASMKPLLEKPVYNKEQCKWQIFFEDIEEGAYYFLFEPILANVNML